jgi:predicted TIM-barrel fold metal-dependent hydrolase
MPAGELTALALEGHALRTARIVDFHVHLERWGRMHYPVAEDGLLREMDRVGLETACVNGVLHPVTSEGNRAVADFARRHPGRAVGFAALNPFQHRMTDELRRCVEQFGFRGIKLHSLVGQDHRLIWSCDPREAGSEWDAVFDLAAEFRLPILYHGVVTEEDIRHHPATTFVTAHGLCGAGGERAKRRLAALPNLLLETSLTRNTLWEAEETVRIFGPRRILWGSDAPLADFAHRLGIILDLDVPDEDKLAILGGNARRLLALDSQEAKEERKEASHVRCR